MRAFQYLPILIFLISSTNFLLAQQTPFLNHYTWNARLFNPAEQGADGNGELTAVFRSQFQSLETSDRPNTYLFHADFSPWFGERIGLAAQVMGDKAHILSRFQFKGFFSYHLLRNDRFRLSLGVSGGILTHSFDFDGLRLSDILDLSVFYGQLNTTRFDGGPGLGLEYKFRNGSSFAFNAAAAQIFSSDIRIDGPDDSALNGALYDVIPHILTNLRYRYQRNGFAVEPNVTYRALTGSRGLKGGVFDLNVNTYFLKNDRLMVGAGMRTDRGGFHFQLGVTPASSLRLIASAELHSSLGATYEIGASYSFGRDFQPPPPAEPLIIPVDKNLVEDFEKEVRSLSEQFEQEATKIRADQKICNTSITAGNALTNRQKKVIAADSCVARLGRTSKQLEKLRQTASAIDVKRLKAEQQIRDATNRGANVSSATLASLQAINTYSANANGQLQEMSATQTSLNQQCADLRPPYDEYACIQNGDADCISNFFQKALEGVSGIPENLYPMRTFIVPGAAAITYHYPDDTESYQIPTNQRVLADHLASQLRELEGQGVLLDNLTLITELQEDKVTLGYRLNSIYGGEIGAGPIYYALIDNEDGETTVQKTELVAGQRISLEILGALKLTALKNYLIEAGVPPTKISLQIRYNHTANFYREESKMVLRLRAGS